MRTEAGQELAVANMVVEYGPVELGGTKYVCPLKGIAFAEDSLLAWLNDEHSL